MDFTDPSAPSLAKLQVVARLRVDNNKFTDNGIAALAPLKKLEYLNIYGNPALREACRWGTSMSPAGVRKLQQQRPELRVGNGDKPIRAPVPPRE